MQARQPVFWDKESPPFHCSHINSRVNTNKMGFCALNGIFWAATAGFVGGMASPAAAQARGMTAHGKYMAKKQEKVRVTHNVHLLTRLFFIHFFS